MEDILFALEACRADRQLHLWSTYFTHYLLTAAAKTLYLLAWRYEGISATGWWYYIWINQVLEEERGKRMIKWTMTAHKSKYDGVLLVLVPIYFFFPPFFFFFLVHLKDQVKCCFTKQGYFQFHHRLNHHGQSGCSFPYRSSVVASRSTGHPAGTCASCCRWCYAGRCSCSGWLSLLSDGRPRSGHRVACWGGHTAPLSSQSRKVRERDQWTSECFKQKGKNK